MPSSLSPPLSRRTPPAPKKKGRRKRWEILQIIIQKWICLKIKPKIEKLFINNLQIKPEIENLYAYKSKQNNKQPFLHLICFWIKYVCFR